MLTSRFSAVYGLLMAFSSFPSFSHGLPQPPAPLLARAQSGFKVSGFPAGSGNNGKQTAHSNSPAATDLFSCSVSVPSAGGIPTYSAAFPNQLQFLEWVATGSVECSEPMGGIEFSVWAIDPQGNRINVATAPSCVGCASAGLVSNHDFCQQPEVGGKCAGLYEFAYQAVIEAPPGSEWTTGTGGCILAGPTLTCTASAPRNYPPFEFITMPPGYQDKPQLDALAIQGIRATHFEGGANQDSSKGLFFPSITDADLQTIFRAGLESSASWGRSASGNWQKDFPYSGVGVKSKDSGAGPSSQITLIITPAGGQVNTMFPS